jgi:Putative Ig domain
VVNGVPTAPPSGMSINPLTGTIRWIPTSSQLGPQTVVVRLTDSAGSSVTQTDTIQVVTNAAPPQITTTPSTTGTITELYVVSCRQARMNRFPSSGEILGRCPLRTKKDSRRIAVSPCWEMPEEGLEPTHPVTDTGF